MLIKSLIISLFIGLAVQAQEGQVIKVGASGVGHLMVASAIKVPNVACKVTPNSMNNGIFILESHYPGNQGSSFSHNVDVSNNQGKKIDMSGWAAFGGPSDYPTDFAMGIYRYDAFSGTSDVDTVAEKHFNLLKTGGSINATVTGTTVDGIKLTIICKSLPQ